MTVFNFHLCHILHSYRLGDLMSKMYRWFSTGKCKSRLNTLLLRIEYRVESQISIHLKCNSIHNAQFVQNSTNQNIWDWPLFYALESQRLCKLRNTPKFKTRLQNFLCNDEQCLHSNCFCGTNIIMELKKEKIKLKSQM